MNAKPHVVWIMCDQLRADKLGFMGDPLARTPNLDRLAAGGTTFENLYVQSSVCLASRSSMLTGRYPAACRMRGGSSLLDPREVTWPQLLRRAGYRTGLFGKLHVTPQQYTLETLKSTHPINDAAVFAEKAGLGEPTIDPNDANYGFVDAVSMEDALPGAYAAWVARYEPQLAAMLPAQGMKPWPGWNRLFPGTELGDVGPTIVPPALHPSMYIATHAADYFRQHHAGGPCALQVSFIDPHHPFDPPKELLDRYDIAAMPLPRHRTPGSVTWPPTLQARTRDFSKVTDEQTRTTIACYYAMIEMIDLAVGHLVETIERAGELDNTLFVFVADHGELLGDSGLWRKGSYHYDCITRVPSFVRYSPRVPAGHRVTELVESIDLTTTMLSLAGVERHAGMQGIDWSGGLRGESAIGRPWVYTDLYTASWGPFVNVQTVRTATAKLNYFPDDRVGHLFDLQADPQERRDVWGDPGHRGLRDEMTANLLQCISDQVDPLPRVLSQY